MVSIPKTNRATISVIWGVALFLVILGMIAVRSITRERVTVHTAQVTYKDLVKSISTTGKVELTDDFEAHAQAAGQVQDVYVDAGEKVKPGQLLLKMDDKYALASLAHAQSQLQAAELALNDIEHGGSQDERNTSAADLSRAQLQRQQDAADLAARQKLLQQGAASQAEVAAAQHRLEVDDNLIHSIQQRSTQRYGDADRARAQAELADARAGVVAAQRTYDTADIRTPFAGTVYSLSVAQYDYVSNGDDLVYVADLTKKKVVAYFDEPDIGSLAVGQPVKIAWEAKPGNTWQGQISQVPTTIKSYLTRFIGECLIAVDDANGVLEPNANVNVTVTTAQHAHVLSVPREALRYDGGQAYVFRIVDERLVRTAVKTGIINLNDAEIASGLSEGDTVATSATTPRDLSNGLEVKAAE
jgi:HlyD family secretion protein